ncbi:kinesin light chain, partial [Lophium mytilinum]
MAPQLRREDYTIGWICALPIELAAAQEMLEEEHPSLGLALGDNDENLYALGSIGGHNVVIGCLPAGQIGTNSAAAVAVQMRATFKRIRFGLMVGIGGGVPSAEADIRLGDVVVSQPESTFGGVVQFDLGLDTLSGFKRMGSLAFPPTKLLGAVARVRANENRGRSRLAEHIAKFDNVSKFQRTKTGPDILFKATYDHEKGPTCDRCSAEEQESRPPREKGEEVMVHYGTIASGNLVMKNAAERDRVSAELDGVLCFEMEAAGLMNRFPCLVIRGICDYADSHKNKKWQPYAAGTAAAWAKELLSVLMPSEVTAVPTVEEAMESASKPAIYYIPFFKNPSFTGREHELDVLKEKLMENPDCHKMSIAGLGGTGKTQIALQFAYKVKEAWPDCSIFWMSALSMETFEQACVEVAKLLRIPRATDPNEDAKELVKECLSAAQAGRWLIVLDNADDPGIIFGTKQSKGIYDYLPRSEEGLFLFTTRTPDVVELLTDADGVIELEAMNPEDAADFLEKSLKPSLRKDLLRDSAATSELLDELTYLPLAIAQAAAYLNRKPMSIAKYLGLLRSTEQSIVRLMSREFRDITRYKLISSGSHETKPNQNTSNAVATTWVVSFNQIRTQDPAAATLLEFMSCVEWKSIPRSILPSVRPQDHMDEAIGTLCAYSFLARRQKETREKKEGEEEWYDIHRLVHLATRIWINQANVMAIITHKALRRVTKVFPADRHENQAVWRAYMPHAIRLLEILQDSDFEERSELCWWVGRCLDADGRIREAVKWLEESCRGRNHLDEDNSSRLSSEHALAGAYYADGQIKKAVKLLEHVVNVRKKVLEEEHPNQLASQHGLAGAYQADGQIEKAVKLLEHVVNVRKKVLEEDHPDRLASEHALAGAYQADGQVKEAVELLEH